MIHSGPADNLFSPFCFFSLPFDVVSNPRAVVFFFFAPAPRIVGGCHTVDTKTYVDIPIVLSLPSDPSRE
jgi:hypothetical protein